MTDSQKLKIYLNKISEDWIIDRTYKEWYKANNSISTKYKQRSNLIWIIAPWTWNKLNKKNLENKKVLCSIYHIDEEKFDQKAQDEFKARDYFVDEYHVISKNTENQIQKLTNKKITTLPFWVNTNIWFDIANKNQIKDKYKLDQDNFYIGSFQRDSEGSDLDKPKLSKGPDRFVEIVSDLNKEIKNLHVVVTGKRRNYIINELTDRGIKFSYFEMVNFESLNELYNCLDLYIVASRYEGGPQAVLECGVTKTPIISTDVGIAKEILSSESIFDMSNYAHAKPNVEIAYKNSQEISMAKMFPKYIKMFEDLIES